MAAVPTFPGRDTCLQVGTRIINHLFGRQFQAVGKALYFFIQAWAEIIEKVDYACKLKVGKYTLPRSEKLQSLRAIFDRCSLLLPDFVGSAFENHMGEKQLISGGTTHVNTFSQTPVSNHVN